MLPVFGVTSLVFGYAAGLFAISIMIGLFGLFYLYVFFRTRNAYLLVICAECAFLVLMLALIYVNPIGANGRFIPNPFEKIEYRLYISAV